MKKEKVWCRGLDGYKKTLSFARVISNFKLPERIEGKCALLCPRPRWRIGQEYELALVDPICPKGKWTYAGSAKKDPRSREFVKEAPFNWARWCLFVQNHKWIAVMYRQVTEKKNI